MFSVDEAESDVECCSDEVLVEVLFQQVGHATRQDLMGGRQNGPLKRAGRVAGGTPNKDFRNVQENFPREMR